MYQQKNDSYLLLTSAAIQGHLLQVYFFTIVPSKILDSTKSTLQLLVFCLRERLKKFIINCTCKISCGNRCACKKPNTYAQNMYLKY